MLGNIANNDPLYLYKYISMQDSIANYQLLLPKLLLNIWTYFLKKEMKSSTFT
jgi:hypothetical protein